MRLQLFAGVPEDVAIAKTALDVAEAATEDAVEAKEDAAKAVAEAAGNSKVTDAQFAELVERYEKLQADHDELAGRVNGWQAAETKPDNSPEPATVATAEPEPLAVAVPAEVLQTPAASPLSKLWKGIW